MATVKFPECQLFSPSYGVAFSLAHFSEPARSASRLVATVRHHSAQPVHIMPDPPSSASESRTPACPPAPKLAALLGRHPAGPGLNSDPNRARTDHSLLFSHDGNGPPTF